MARPRIYPWEKWFEEDQFILTDGVDYHCSQMTMGQQIRQEASKRHLAISIKEMEGSLVVRVVKRVEEPSVFKQGELFSA